MKKRRPSGRLCFCQNHLRERVDRFRPEKLDHWVGSENFPPANAGGSDRTLSGQIRGGYAVEK
jgi:hypothetical protein